MEGEPWGMRRRSVGGNEGCPREHYRDIARKTEYREYFAPSSSLIFIYSMYMASNPRIAVTSRCAAYFSYT
jgi:hypothetical protein